MQAPGLGITISSIYQYLISTEYYLLVYTHIDLSRVNIKHENHMVLWSKIQLTVD